MKQLSWRGNRSKAPLPKAKVSFPGVPCLRKTFSDLGRKKWVFSCLERVTLEELCRGSFTPTRIHCFTADIALLNQGTMETLAYLHLSLWYETGSCCPPIEIPRSNPSPCAEWFAKQNQEARSNKVDSWRSTQPQTGVYVLMP
jgi:hypothetical protein